VRRLPRGLYAITDGPYATTHALETAVSAAIAGGAVMVQYRDKSGDAARRLEEAHALRALCRAARVIFIINDDVALAAAVEADGVHVGKGDAACHDARSCLGAQAIVGLSCYNDFSRAAQAAVLGADYVAFGSFYPSSTKPEAVPATPQLLTRAKRELDLPVVAIGGITPENGAPLVAAGADLLAVISGVFGAADVTAAARAYTQLFR